MTPFDRHSYFFDQGIRFACQRCGACCTGDPGIVRVSSHEIDAIAAYLDLSVSSVRDGFMLPWEDAQRIREHSDGRCFFFDDGCRIYPVRPEQCRTYPFWLSHLRSEKCWNAIRRQCPGIGTGPHYTKADILDMLENGF